MANTFTGYYSTTTTYQINDYTVYGGKLYRALTISLGASPILNPGAWTVSSNTFTYKNNWTANTTYNIGDTVRYANVSFVLVGGTSNNQTPGLINSNWKVFNNNYKNIVTYQPGDIQYQGATLPQRLPVGNVDRILAVDDDGEPNWLRLTDTIPPGNTNQFLALAANGQVYWRNAVVTQNLGDLQYQGANGVYISLPVGANGTVLTANANSYLFWSDVTGPINQQIRNTQNNVLSLTNTVIALANTTANLEVSMTLKSYFFSQL